MDFDKYHNAAETGYAARSTGLKSCDYHQHREILLITASPLGVNDLRRHRRERSCEFRYAKIDKYHIEEIILRL